MRKSWLLYNFALVLTLIAAPSRAVVHEFHFTGFVDGLGTNLESEFSIGEAVIGSYRIDTDSLWLQGSRTLGTATDLSVTIGGDYTISADEGSVIIDPGTWYLVSFSSNANFTAAAVGGSPPAYFDIQLNDDNGVLTNGVLPKTIDPDQFGWDRSNVNFPDDLNRLDFEVQSIVPEPGVALLLLPCCIAFYSRRRAIDQ